MEYNYDATGPNAIRPIAICGDHEAALLDAGARNDACGAWPEKHDELSGPPPRRYAVLEVPYVAGPLEGVLRNI